VSPYVCQWKGDLTQQRLRDRGFACSCRGGGWGGVLGSRGQGGEVIFFWCFADWVGSKKVRVGKFGR